MNPEDIGSDLDQIDSSREDIENEINDSQENTGDIERELENIEDATENIGLTYDNMEEQLQYAETIISDLSGALQKKEDETGETSIIGKTSRRGFLGLLGLGGLAGLLDSAALEDRSFRTSRYETVVDEINGLEEFSDWLSETENNYQDRLAAEIDSALANHNRVAIGLYESRLPHITGYGDIGVRKNEFADYTLQSRTELDDGYFSTLQKADEFTRK